MLKEINIAASWVMSNDTGVSSKTIWSVMVGGVASENSWVGTPHDDDDFGRCHRLLKLIPSWRARLPEVAAAFPEWAPLVEIWDELEALHEAGESEKVCDAIEKCEPAIRKVVRSRR